MNLLQGMEMFGISGDEALDITKDETTKRKAATVSAAAAPVEYSEEDFLIDKKVECAVCDKQLDIKALKSTKLRKLESDRDLRPRFEYIDSLKYDAIFCPYCGYAALTRYFDKVSPTQRKLIKAEITANFEPTTVYDGDVYTYDYAVECHKMALVNAMKKRSKVSEKAYICLKISWLRDAQYQDLLGAPGVSQEELAQIKMEADGFYKQAFEGFLKAQSTELAPICGMDSNTLDFMLANMAVKLEQYEFASKMVSTLLTSNSVNRKIKDKCLDMKEEIKVGLKK